MAEYAPPGQGLMTNTDAEIQGLKGVNPIHDPGPNKAANLEPTATEGPEDRSLPWRVFTQRHPEYNADFWEECRALYAGGPRLLENPKLMERLFPKRNAEENWHYADRCQRAHYFPYAGSIIDHLVAGLGADPLSVQVDDSDDEGATLPEWWEDWAEDISPPGGKRQALSEILVDAIREALITRQAWILVDLPQTPEEGVEDAPESLLDQERRGLLNPYAIAIDPEYVIDWQLDQNGELEWALLCDAEHRRDDITQARGFVTKTFTLFDSEGWQRWRITYDPKRPPKPDSRVSFLDEGKHAFKRVPLVRIQLPEGLWAMGKLHNLAREHFNKRCAAANAEERSLAACLFEFLAPEEPGTQPISAAQQDPDRAVNQVRGPGWVQERGHLDSAAFIGPDSAPFAEARESCAQIMREMHRVMFSIALSVDMSSGAIKRSGESKSQDRAMSAVILKALGVILRSGARDVIELVQVVKGEFDHRMSGVEKFDSVDIAAAVTEAVELLNGVPIKSATFKIAYLMRLYKLVMGDELTEAEIQEIKAELEAQISSEDMMLEAASMLGLGGGTEPPPGEDDDDDEGDDDETPEDRAAKRGKVVKGGPGKTSAGGRRVYSSGG